MAKRQPRKPTSKAKADPKAKAKAKTPAPEPESASFEPIAEEQETQNVESAQTQTASTAAEVEEVKIPEPAPVDNSLFRRGRDQRPRGADEYWVFINGYGRWLTGPAVNTAIKRKERVEIPEGSPFVPEDGIKDVSNCRGCGK